MFKNGGLVARVRDIKWSDVGNIGAYWQLLSFDMGAPEPVWESYLQEQIKYWHAHDTNDPYFVNHFGNRGRSPAEEFRIHVEKGFKEYSEHVKNWFGLCKIGERVQVIHCKDNVIALSKQWKGRITDHSDIELWLKEELSWGVVHKRYCCEVYSFGTIEGERRVSHRQDFSGDRDPTFAIHTDSKHGNVVLIGNAKFAVR